MNGYMKEQLERAKRSDVEHFVISKNGTKREFTKGRAMEKRHAKDAKSKALRKMIDTPDGKKVREGSSKHEYWKDIIKRGGKNDSYN